MSNLLDRARKLAGGVPVLIDWLGSGGAVVDQETAQSRTDICQKCPLNRPGIGIAESVAKAIKNQMQLKNSLGLRTNGIKSLHSCGACECYLPLKIWLPLEQALSNMDASEISQLDPSCWLMHEK